MLALGLCVIAGGLLLPSPGRMILLAAGAVLIGVALAYVVQRRASIWRAARELRSLVQIADLNFDPLIVTDADGAVRYANDAATGQIAVEMGQPLSAALHPVIAGSTSCLRDLMRRARSGHKAVHDLRASDRCLRLSALRSGESYLWRIETRALDEGAGDSLHLSIPALALSSSGAIQRTTPALRRLVPDMPGTLDALIADLPLRPGATHLMHGADGLRPVRIDPLDLPGVEETALAILPQTHPSGHWAEADALPLAVMRLRPDGTVLGANAAALAIFDCPGAMPAHFNDLVEGLGRPLNEWLCDVAAGRGVGKAEVLRARMADEDRFLQVALRPFEHEGERVLLAVLTDATELKSLELQFVQSQKMQAIGQLAGGVAHDFNNLLTAISGHCDLLLLSRDEGDPEYGDLMQISHNANRAASLVGQLLAFSRNQTLQLAPLDLRDTLAEMAHLLNRLVGERVRLVQHHDPALTRIRGDQRQIEQVLMNLVVNARDALLPEGGEIMVTTETRHLTQPLKRDRATVPAGEYVTLSVVDDGCGIPPDKIDRIFEPFFTTKRPGEGTGLGLSTVYGIVKQLGGFIFCDSTPGEGTSFILYFAAHRGTDDLAPPQPAPKAPSAAEISGGVVLLVEDEAPVRAFAARALRLRGHVVIEAANAEDALTLLEDAQLAVDIFVTDVVMPGLDGPSWVKRALENRPGTRVIFVSGYSEEAVARQRADVANSVFLPKPFSLSQLTDAVARQLSA